MYFNSFTSNARGVCILFSSSVAYKVLRSCKDDRGNMLILDIELEGKNSHWLIYMALMRTLQVSF